MNWLRLWLPLFLAAALAAQTRPNPMAVEIVGRLRVAAQEPDAGRRKAVLRQAADELPRGLYPAVLNLLVPIPPNSRDLDIAQAVFLRWAWETPDFAARWAQASPPEPFRMEALAEAASRWAERHPDSAARWAETLRPQDTTWVRSAVTRFLRRTNSPALAAWEGEIGPPVRLAVYGLEHDHARLLFPSLKGRRDVTLAGIVETNPAEIAYYREHFQLAANLFYPSLAALRAATPVDAVAAFTSTFRHREVVEQCAKLGIDVMVEKPFAVDLAAARAMSEAAHRGGIDVIVNYETSWYPSNHLAFDLVRRRHAIGELRKILVMDGNGGPLSPAINCTPFFQRWLTEPALGGGARLDFGCYGADLVTWMMEGRRPSSVTAVLRHLQPALPANIEDDATIVLTYPDSEAVILASWDWPFGRKDMEVYGTSGSLKAKGGDSLLERLGERSADVSLDLPPLQGREHDSLSELVAVVRKQARPDAFSSVETNLVVTEILDAARESARTGRRVELN